MTTDTRQSLKDSIKSGSSIGRYYKGLHFGEFGAAKTVTAGFISRSKFLVVATDNGFTSLDNHKELVDKYDVVMYDGLSQLNEIAAWAHESDFPYDLVHVDTVSQVQEEYLDFLLEEISWSQKFRESSAPKRRGAETVEVPGRADYHVTRNKMRVPIKNLVKAPVDVVFSAHVREPSDEDKAKGILTRRPTMTQTVYQLMAREASVMALFERTKTNGIQIICETDKKQVAKSRIKSLDNVTVNVDEFVKRIHAWKDGE